MQDYAQLLYWCALWRTPKIGAKRFAKILELFGTPEQFFTLPSHEQKRVGISIDQATCAKSLSEAEKDIAWLENTENASIITLADELYPARLKTISDPPPILFARGNTALLKEPQLAVVGSRSPSHEGIENAKNFSRYLTQNGIVITSGLAQGIDGMAHEGALSAKNDSHLSGETIAVMGTGADRIYPAKHQALAHRIIETGCIITELPIGTPVVPHAFPRRNRIISGLSLGTLVVEATLKSGSLITARTALEQNREIFAIPGSIHNPLARGCNHLIRNGAKLVETAKDIFEELKPELLAFVENEKSDTLNIEVSSWVNNDSVNIEENTQPDRLQKEEIVIQTDDDPDKATLWQALSYEPQPVDILVKRSGLAPNKVSSMLLILELGGHVIKQAGGRYQKRGQQVK